MNGGAAEAALLTEMKRLAPPTVRLGCRMIGPNDEALLLPDEVAAITSRQPAARRASGTARSLVRCLLALEDAEEAPIGRSPAGAPLWPRGFVGSLAHDAEMAVAAIARSVHVPSLGIDVEPAEPLPDDIAALVLTSGDVLSGVEARFATRVLYSAKEAAYKAAYPLDGEVLGYEHINVDLARREAVTAGGRRMRLSFCTLPRVVVLAAAVNG